MEERPRAGAVPCSSCRTPRRRAPSDVDGNEYIDSMCAYGRSLLGYAHPEIAKAVVDQQALGDIMTGPCSAMVELAQAFVDMVSHADRAIFCKNGADAISMAPVTACAYRNRRKVLIAKNACHGAASWNTPLLAGIAPEDRAYIIYFDGNDLDSLTAAANFAGDDLAAVFATPCGMEIFADQTPLDADGAKGVRALCDDRNALLVVDDVRSGFRLARDCSWSVADVKPDLSAWGKVIGDG